MREWQFVFRGSNYLVHTRFLLQQRAKFAAVGTLPPPQLRGYLEALTKMIADGQLRAMIDRKYPLGEAAAAHRYVDSGRKRGNVVLVPVAAF